jgi:hypothetical protein
MSEEKKESRKVGQVLTGKNGGHYIKIEQSVTLTEGDVLFLNKPEETLQRLVAAGTITQAEADAKLAKVPSFVKYNIVRKNTQTEKTF